MGCLKINGREETDPAILSRTFNIFFSTIIAQRIESKLVQATKHFTDYLTEPIDNALVLTPTNAEKIEDKIKALNMFKSVGPNIISTKLLKRFSKDISVPLENLFNLSFEKGSFPKAMKLATIIPVFNREDSLQCNNYRPIPLTSKVRKFN